MIWSIFDLIYRFVTNNTTFFRYFLLAPDILCAQKNAQHKVCISFTFDDFHDETLKTIMDQKASDIL